MTDALFEYRGIMYPTYLRDGNACRFIIEVAKHFCRGNGLDVGAGKWPLPGAVPVDPFVRKYGSEHHALSLPSGVFDYIFSSHCLEHLDDPIRALEHWKSRLRNGGVLFLYLPHPDMVYWRPENCRKHKHSWSPERMREILWALNFENVLISGRDMMWSFTAIGHKPD